MKRFILGLILSIIFCFMGYGFTQEFLYPINSVEQRFVRVGISDNSFSKYLFENVSVTSDYDFTVSDNSSFEQEFKGGQIVYVTFKNGVYEIFNNSKSVAKTNNKITFSSAGAHPLSIVGLKRKGKQALYSGNIELYNLRSDKFAIVNVLPLQTYLKGVVPNEMPTSFGLEALKAQAVLARNYVLKPRENYYKEFDICDSTACQVYFGANTQEKLSDKAVDETENIVVMYDKDLILAVYSSTAGGHTESYKNVFMQNMNGRIMSPNVPYLIGKPDNNDIPKNLESDEKAREFYLSYPETFDNTSPYFRWERQWTKNELETTLKKTLPSVKNTGFIKTKYDVNYSDSNFLGHIKSIFINKRGVSGKIIALTIITDKNEFTIYKELIIRRVLQNGGKMLPSANFVLDFDNDTITAKGAGLGHGVGMSQWGAGAMAKKGYKFEDIIHHYYTNVKLAVIPTKKPSAVEFFLDSKKADLHIENNMQLSDLNIIINNKEMDIDFKKRLIRDKKIDISHYLKRGKNVVIYDFPSGRNAKFRIEINE